MGRAPCVGPGAPLGCSVSARPAVPRLRRVIDCLALALPVPLSMGAVFAECVCRVPSVFLAELLIVPGVCS